MNEGNSACGALGFASIQEFLVPNSSSKKDTNKVSEPKSVKKDLSKFMTDA
jgi:hypothetical protein